MKKFLFLSLFLFILSNLFSAQLPTTANNEPPLRTVVQGASITITVEGETRTFVASAIFDSNGNSINPYNPLPAELFTGGGRQIQMYNPQANTYYLGVGVMNTEAYKIPVYWVDSKLNTVNVYITGYGSQMAMGVSSTVVDRSRNYSLILMPHTSNEGFGVYANMNEYVQYYEGKKFQALYEDEDLDTTEELFLIMDIPNGIKLNLNTIVNSTGMAKLYLYEDVNYTGGTALNVINRNRTSSNTSNVSVYYGSATTTAGTLISQDVFSNLNGKDTCKLTLKGGVSYLVRVRTIADNNDVLVKLIWCEQ